MLSIVGDENNIAENVVKIVCAVLCSLHAASIVAAILGFFMYIWRGRAHFIAFLVLVIVQLVALTANVVAIAAIDVTKKALVKKLSIGAAVAGTFALGGIAGVIVSFTFRRPGQTGE